MAHHSRTPAALRTTARVVLPSAGDAERGSVTAEYAVVMLAAVAFAGILVAVVRSGAVHQAIADLVRGALTA